MTQVKKIVATVDELERYMDGSERDRIDLVGHSKRVSDLLSLREQLLRLPDDAYDATIFAMRSILTQATGGDSVKTEQNGKKRDSDAAKELYEAARKKASSGTSAKAIGKI
jgi:hypothetical protein